MSEPAKIPLIAAGERALAGEAREASDFYDAANQDMTYVRGYSDRMRAFAADKALATTEHRKVKVALPPHRLQWVTVKSPGSGQPMGQKASEWHAKGYRPMTVDDAKNLGYDPGAAQVDAQNHFVLGDTMLYYCSAEVAARNENVLRRATDDRSSAEATASDLHAEGSRLARSVGRQAEQLTEASLTQKVSDKPT